MMETAHLQTLTVTALISGKGTDATLVKTICIHACPHADTAYMYMYMQLYVMSLVSVGMEAAAYTLTSTVRVS